MNQYLWESTLQQASLFFQQGQIQQAIQLLTSYHEQHPGEAEPLFNLGCLFQAIDQKENALLAYKQTLQLDPQHCGARINLGNICILQENLEEAVEYYKQALDIQPENTDLLSNLGHALTLLGKAQEALLHLERAIKLNPQHVSALNNQGLALAELNHKTEALNCFNQVLALKPNDLSALRNQYLLLTQLERYPEALSACQTTISFYPKHLPTLKTLTNLYGQVRQFQKAHETVDYALTFASQDYECWYAKANLFKNDHRYEDALRCYDTALSLQPNNIPVLIDRGNTLTGLEWFDAALENFDHILKIDSKNTAAYINKAIIYNRLGMHLKATACYEKLVDLLPNDAGIRAAITIHMQHMIEWDNLDIHIKAFKKIVSQKDYLSEPQLSRAMPSTLLSASGINPHEQLLFAKKYTGIMRPKNQLPSTHHVLLPQKDKIHVGYFSADFNHHPVTQLMVEVFELHNRSKFKISAYSAKKGDGSTYRTRVEKSVDHFIDIKNMSNHQVVDLIKNQQVDILVDLSGYTESSRSDLLFFRPAPIQINYLGFLGTMGADFIDYIFADEFLIPHGQEHNYQEKVWRLPSYQANDRQCPIGKQHPRSHYGIPEDAFVFCCFNMNYKITPDFFEVWCRLLKNIPNSVLWLFASSEYAMQNLIYQAKKRGIDSDRLIFANWIKFEDHIARISCADLFLDTAPYNAGTTASNALWAGVPVITCAGETFSSRMAGSLLTAMETPELITFNLDDYYKVALELATDNQKRISLKNSIIKNKNSALLFDSINFTNNLEQAYEEMVRRYCDNTR